MRRNGFRSLALLIAGLIPADAYTAPLSGDLDGDGAVGASDEALIAGSFGSGAGDPAYLPLADLNSDGAVDLRDIALFGRSFGKNGGAIDTTPPSLRVTLSDIPDDMDDLLVAPPDEFEITLHYSDAGSIIDTASLTITSDRDIGAIPADSELAGHFEVSQTRAAWVVPPGSDLDRNTHYLTARIRDIAGNETAQVIYGFAVRDFPVSGPPLENLQTVFLDFDQDRSGSPEIDFIEDLRHYDLSSPVDLAVEATMRDWIVSEILMRVHPYVGRSPDGSPGADPLNVVFTDVDPGPIRTRICVGGESQQGALFLGSAVLDPNNAIEVQDDCTVGAFYGVFPQAIDNLWGSDPEFLDVFAPLVPLAGGTPVGEGPLDATVTAPGFDPDTAPAPERARWEDIANAVDAFAQLLATVVVHETSHTLGLVAHGDAPAGLFGGTAGGNADHNVTATGSTPTQNFLMNAGGSFSFDEMTGRNGSALPFFRAMNQAYLKDRIVLNSQVTGLFPEPVVLGVTPDPVVFGGGFSAVQITITGEDIMPTPDIDLLPAGLPPPSDVGSEVYLDPQTATGYVSPFLVAPGTYDVRLKNPDGQVAILEDGLVVLP